MSHAPGSPSDAGKNPKGPSGGLIGGPEELDGGTSQAVIAEAWCWIGRATPSRLMATELSPQGAFIVTMMPPQVGTELEIVLCPRWRESIPPIKARVVENRLDVTDAWGTGFGAQFIAPSSTVVDAIEEIVERAKRDVRRKDVGSTTRKFAERRLHPRVHVDLMVMLHLPWDEVAATVEDLGMGGALLNFPHLPLWEPPESEQRVILEFPVLGKSETVPVLATICHVDTAQGIVRVGVEFRALEDYARRCVESHILAALSQIDAASGNTNPDAPHDPGGIDGNKRR